MRGGAKESTFVLRPLGLGEGPRGCKPPSLCAAPLLALLARSAAINKKDSFQLPLSAISLCWVPASAAESFRCAG